MVRGTMWMNLKKDYAKYKKRHTKQYILYDWIYVKFLEKTNVWRA